MIDEVKLEEGISCCSYCDETKPTKQYIETFQGVCDKCAKEHNLTLDINLKLQNKEVVPVYGNRVYFDKSKWDDSFKNTSIPESGIIKSSRKKCYESYHDFFWGYSVEIDPVEESQILCNEDFLSLVPIAKNPSKLPSIEQAAEEYVKDAFRIHLIGYSKG